MWQKSYRQKVAMRANGRLYIQNNSACKRSDSEQQLLPTSRHHTNPISPRGNVTADFQKRKKKKEKEKEEKYILKTPDF
jgi:hypothetical protein